MIDFSQIIEKITPSIIIFGIVILIFYIIIAIFLSKLNRVMYGKKTIISWIPILNIYLLGKLSVNKLIGWLLVIISFLISSYDLTILNKHFEFSFIPDSLKMIFGIVYIVILIFLIVVSIFKYKRLKLNEKDRIEINNNQQKIDNDSNDSDESFYANCKKKKKIDTKKDNSDNNFYNDFFHDDKSSQNLVPLTTEDIDSRVSNEINLQESFNNIKIIDNSPIDKKTVSEEVPLKNNSIIDKDSEEKVNDVINNKNNSDNIEKDNDKVTQNIELKDDDSKNETDDIEML